MSLGATSALLLGQLQVDWPKYGEVVIGLLTILQGAILVLSSYTDSMLIAYTTYVVFGMLYNILLVITK